MWPFFYFAQCFQWVNPVPFETEARPEGRHGGGDVIYALLNEDQACFLLTLSRFFQKSEGFRFIGIEQSPEYFAIARTRIANAVRDNFS